MRHLERARRSAWPVTFGGKALAHIRCHAEADTIFVVQLQHDNKEVEPKVLTPAGVRIIEPLHPARDLVLGGRDDLNRELVGEAMVLVVTLPGLDKHHRRCRRGEAETCDSEPQPGGIARPHGREAEGDFIELLAEGAVASQPLSRD
jgi:hypothetical protein